MILLGLVFTLSATAESESSIVNILFGAITTGLGFVVFRKALRSRGLLMACKPTGTPGKQISKSRQKHVWSGQRF